MASSIERKLTTILATDVEGYSRLMAADETAAMAALKEARAVFIRLIERHRGRIANTAGDGVNLAARLQAMAEPDGVLISQAVYDQVRSKLSLGYKFLGQRRPKNLDEPVPVYRLVFADATAVAAAEPAPPGHDSAMAAPSAAAPTAPGELQHRVSRQAQRFAIVWAGLAAINLVAGGGEFWAVWPGIALLAVLGLQAAPLLARGWVDVQLARLGVIVAALALVNLASWSSEPWFLWPTGALLVLYLLWRTFRP